jgi:hypothetical protein
MNNVITIAARGSYGSSVGITAGSVGDGRGTTVRLQAVARNVLLLNNVHAGSGTTPPHVKMEHGHIIIKKTPWSESASELYRPSDRRLSAK